MATWGAHLRVAENLLALIDELDPCQFLIGNIAPDSGMPDEKWQTFEPPWEVTHFTGEGRVPWPLGDLEFYREYLNTSNCPTKDKKEYSFLLGYFFHLVTDTLWHYDVGMPTKKRYPQFDKDSQFAWELKRDWYGLDFLYLWKHPESIFWGLFQKCECTEGYLDFLPTQAIRNRIEGIRRFYQNKEQFKYHTNRPFVYLSAEVMGMFVERSTQKIKNIHDYLRNHKPDISRGSSVLQLQPGSVETEKD